MSSCSPVVERREHFRVDVALPVAYWSDTEHVPHGLSAMPVNISGSGMRLTAGRAYSVGQTMSLRIGLPDGVVPAMAEIVRVQGQPDRTSHVCMQFTAIGSQDQERLVQYIYAA